jgi:hypothetical protein
MAVFFIPDLVQPHDPAGWGRYLIGHYLEHGAMALAASRLTPAVFIKDYGFQKWSDDSSAVVSWHSTHMQVHQALRSQSGVSGIDLSAVDMSDEEGFLDWQENHRVEHASLRRFYGL